MTPGPITRVLLAVAGTDRAVLAEVPTDVNKQAGLGGAVLVTAALAIVSATVAIRMSLDAPLWVALIFGLAWAIAILSIDRWLVVATVRQAKKR